MSSRRANGTPVRQQQQSHQRVMPKLDITIPPNYPEIMARIDEALSWLAPGEKRIVQGNVEVVTLADLPVPVVQAFLHSIGDIRSLIVQLNAAGAYVERLEAVADAAYQCGAEITGTDGVEESLAPVESALDALFNFYKLYPDVRPGWAPEETLSEVPDVAS